MQAALRGVKVLDLSRYVAGAYCAKLMAAFGADVVKVEPPGTGDPARGAGPFLHDRPDAETSALFLYLNTGKRGLTLNLKHPRGADILRALVRDCDVLVENFSPRVMPGLGLAFAHLKTLNPRLVMVSISSFGQTGPYRDYKAGSLVSFALGGYMYVNGDPDREPLGGPGKQPAYQGALHGYSGALAALLARERLGVGQHVDISIHECMASIHQFTLNRFEYTGRIHRRIGNGYDGSHPIGIFPCRDGLVSLGVSTLEQYERFLRWIGMPELTQDPRFATHWACSGHRAAFNERMAPWLRARDRHEVVMGCQERRIPAAFVHDVAGILDIPQYAHRGFWHEIDHPVAGRHRYAGLPFLMSATPPALERAPLLGEHTDAILAERLGCGRGQLDELRSLGAI